MRPVASVYQAHALACYCGSISTPCGPVPISTTPSRVPSDATIRLYGTAPQVGTYVLLGVGDVEAADDTGAVGEARPGVGAGAGDDPDAEGAEPAGLEGETTAFDDLLEHPALSTRATPIPSAGASQDCRTCIGRWYGNYNRWQYCYGRPQIFDSTRGAD